MSVSKKKASPEGRLALFAAAGATGSKKDRLALFAGGLPDCGLLRFTAAARPVPLRTGHWFLWRCHVSNSPFKR
jgi:hypothetical protein